MSLKMLHKMDDDNKDKSCYAKSSNSTADKTNWKACGNGFDCCADGDTCLPQHMCYSGQNASHKVEFYPAGCTDKSFPSDKCPGWCAGNVAPAMVTFLSDDKGWQCCGKGNLGQASCNPASGDVFKGPWSRPAYEDFISGAHKLAIGAIIGIVVGAVLVMAFAAFCLFKCCCSRRARDKRARGKFVPLGSGRDIHHEQVVWNSNVHDHHELHEGPMGGYAKPPHGPGMHGAPQYTVQGFR